MRPGAILFLLPGAVLAAGGGVLAYVVKSAPTTVPGMLPAVRHRITPKMIADAEAARRKEAPTVATVDAYGKPLVLGGERAKPQFVYFIKKGCPCSYDAEPFYKALAASYGKAIDFAAVTDGSPEDAKRWNTEMSEPYPLASDESAATMRKFGAKASVYSVLLDANGRVVRMWPGYSKEILLDMNALLAKESGAKAEPFDVKFAPEEKAAGCAFPDR